MLSVCLAEIEKHKGKGSHEKTKHNDGLDWWNCVKPVHERFALTFTEKGTCFFHITCFTGSFLTLSHCSVVSSGVGVITAPINVTAEFKEPLFVPSRVKIKFWEKNRDHSPAQDLVFYMQQHGSNTFHLVGLISR